MTVQVHTYSNPKMWYEHPIFNVLENSIHLCATSNMKKGIQEQYGESLKSIFTIQEFISKHFNSWYSQEIQFQQYLKLSKLIYDLPISNKEIKSAFRSNTLQILESIRNLVQTKVKPEELPVNLTEKEEVFREVWTALEEIDNSYENHRQNLSKELLLKQLEYTFRNLGIKNTATRFNEITIVLHGFYFITPEQQCFLEYLKNSNLNIIFFNYYDNRYPNTFDFSKAFISKRFGWTDDWVVFENKSPFRSKLGEDFLKAFENVDSKFSSLDTKITAYPTFFDFLQSVILPNIPSTVNKDDSNGKNNKVKKTANIIATNADILNDMLVTYYPELNKSNRNFLTYPVGRFLIKLHEIYNGGQLKLTEEILMSLFSSGWLFDQYSNENAQDYTYDLEQIFPYFKGCNEIEEWINRLDNLLNQKAVIEKAFDTISSNRVVKSMQSPFSKISYFSISLEQMRQIKEFIHGIKLIVDDLFEKSKSTNVIDNHFKRLNDIITRQKQGSKSVLNSTELKIVSSLQEKLQSINDSSEFLYDDLQPALFFYLSGKFDPNPEKLITGFIEVDGEAFKNQNQKVYLTGLDEQGLPLDTFELPWPLQSETYEALSKKNKVLEMFTLRNISTKQISRYLFFIALNLQSENTQLSWIENFLNRKNLQPALYIKQLKMQIEKYSSISELDNIVEQPFDFTEIELDKNSQVKGWKSLAFEDFFADYKLCPKRFYYGYILDEYPVFSNDFIHQFLFSEILKVSGQSTKVNFEKLLNELSPIFPQWLEYKKYILAIESYNYIPKRIGKSTKIDDNHSYTDTRRNFQFPGLTRERREKLFFETKDSMSDIQRELLEINSLKLDPTPSYECRFCPHLEYCSDAIYPIDLSKGEAD